MREEKGLGLSQNHLECSIISHTHHLIFHYQPKGATKTSLLFTYFCLTIIFTNSCRRRNNQCQNINNINIGDLTTSLTILNLHQNSHIKSVENKYRRSNYYVLFVIVFFLKTVIYQLSILCASSFKLCYHQSYTRGTVLKNHLTTFPSQTQATEPVNHLIVSRLPVCPRRYWLQSS